MPGEKWRTARDLVSELGAGGSQVEFFQLVQLIERIRCQRSLLPRRHSCRQPGRRAFCRRITRRSFYNACVTGIRPSRTSSTCTTIA